MRYFSGGSQIPGLFETNFTAPNKDPSVTGNWGLTIGDKIEIPLKLVFRAPVTVVSVEDSTNPPQTNFIAGESSNFNASTGVANSANVINIRLQLTCGPN